MERKVECVLYCVGVMDDQRNVYTEEALRGAAKLDPEHLRFEDGKLIWKGDIDDSRVSMRR